MKRSRATLVFTLLLFAGPPLAAQVSTSAAAGESVVTLVSITGIVHPTPEGEPPLPFAILERLEHDPFLMHLEMEARVQTGPALVLTFSFPNVEAYRAWYETPGTRQLLDELRRRVSQLALTVSLRRDPHRIAAVRRN